ncbi:MAG: hypothetical protein LBU20_02065 [Candidatus Nomurabacteria bacterium]|jgi:hypothetical protein|nr:hypothetical protein [Candidatus Nomurabacteria bacterium]
MEPRNDFPNTMAPATPERAGAAISVENAPDTLPNPEILTSSIEQAQSAEQLAVDHAGSMPLPTVPAPTATQTQDVSSPTASGDTSQSATPATAADSNQIEKEWIDKVKQVINHTADDPHAQQREASRLMADYVLKRTGRKIGQDGG